MPISKATAPSDRNLPAKKRKSPRKYGDNKHPQVLLSRQFVAVLWQTSSYAGNLRQSIYNIQKAMKKAEEPFSYEVLLVLEHLYNGAVETETMTAALKNVLKIRKERK